jgi:hypothetical protein
MRAPVVFAVASATLAACAPPPLGFGSGARIPGPPGSAVVEGRTAVGLGEGRLTTQAELSALLRLRSWFGFEGGVVLARATQDVDGGGELTLNGGFPFVRPRFSVGGASLAIGLSGLGAGGGGGGIVGGIADAQLGYGTGTWSAYAGAYRHYFELVSEDAIIASSRQLRLGGQYALPLGASRLGLALEVHHQRDRLRNDPHEQASRYWGAALKLSFTSPAFK